MIRTRLAAFALAALGLVLAGALVAGPPGQGYRVTYYDEAGEVVGGAYANCGGQYTSWGQRTANREIEYFNCD